MITAPTPIMKRASIMFLFSAIALGLFPSSARSQETSAADASNSRPRAADDRATVHAGAKLTVAAPGVLGNDADVDRDTLTVRKIADPVNGTLSMQPDGSFSYKPNGDFLGEDAFTYVAHDGSIESNTATVRIAVRPKTRPHRPR